MTKADDLTAIGSGAGRDAALDQLPAETRHLTVNEQRIMHKALRASTRPVETTPPATSDLRERAGKLIDAWRAMGGSPWHTYRERLVDIVTEALAAIRTEAKAEPTWDDAVKALRESNWPVAGFYADWLAANRPTGRED